MAALAEEIKNSPLDVLGKQKKDDPKGGHTLILGATGSGKTVLQTFLASQAERYGTKTYIFDYRCGQELYTRIAGGKCAVFSENRKQEMKLNPLLLPDTEVNRSFLVNWLAVMCTHAGEDYVSPAIAKQLKKVVDYSYSLEKSSRRLHAVLQVLPTSFERMDELEAYSLNMYSPVDDGIHAWLFDNDEDVIDLDGHLLNFDMTDLVENADPKVYTLVLMYLFRCIENGLNDAPTMIVLDEAWLYFNHPYWVKRLGQWLVTMRKANCWVVMATQQVEHVSNSPLSSTISVNTKTKIFYSNPEAKVESYDLFNLGEKQIDFIKNTPIASRRFLYINSGKTIIAKLDLSGFKRELQMMSGNQQKSAICAELRKKHGEAPEHWVEKFYEILDGEKNAA